MRQPRHLHPPLLAVAELRVVFVTVDGAKFSRTTDRKGELRLDPDLQTHMSWLGGPAIQSDPEAQFELSGSGFDPFTVEWFRHFPERNAGMLENRGVIDLGTLLHDSYRCGEVRRMYGSI